MAPSPSARRPVHGESNHNARMVRLRDVPAHDRRARDLPRRVSRSRAERAARSASFPRQVERADWIVVGHSHFDHLYGAERIARRTGARILGSHETVRVMEAQGVPVEPDDSGRGRREGPALGRRDGRRLPEPTLLCVVADGDGARRRGLHRRPRPDAAGAAEALRRARRALRHARARRDRAPARERAGPARRRRRARLPVRDAARARCSTRTPPVTGAASCATCAPTSRSSRRRAAATSTASRSRARSRSSSPARSICSGRAACCSATTTTGCPASRARST